TVVRLLGYRGCLEDFPFENIMSDSKITKIYEGTNQIQRNEIALALIKETAG
ncbi:MAG: acyl-CoA dehydrogenase family protein, partial [bacterium]